MDASRTTAVTDRSVLATRLEEEPSLQRFEQSLRHDILPRGVRRHRPLTRTAAPTTPGRATTATIDRAAVSTESHAADASRSGTRGLRDRGAVASASARDGVAVSACVARAIGSPPTGAFATAIRMAAAAQCDHDGSARTTPAAVARAKAAGEKAAPIDSTNATRCGRGAVVAIGRQYRRGRTRRQRDDNHHNATKGQAHRLFPDQIHGASVEIPGRKTKHYKLIVYILTLCHSSMPRRQSLFDLRNRLARIQMLGTDLAAIHNRMATIEFKGVVQFGQSALRLSIPTVFNPAVGLHEHGRPEVLVGIPPVGRTGRGAAGTEDAFVHAVEFGAVLFGLEKFLLLGEFGRRRLQPGFNGAILLVEIAHVRHQVLHHVHVRQGIDLGGLGEVLAVDVGKTRQRIGAVDIHGATAANSLATGTAKGERGVLFVFDFDERIEDHGTARTEIDGIST
jgi:hypothetical protein